MHRIFFKKCFQPCLTLLFVIAKGLPASYSLPAYAYVYDLINRKKFRMPVIFAERRMTADKRVCSISLLVLRANRFLKDQGCFIGLLDILIGYSTLQSKTIFLSINENIIS